jgi:hypothetical protein
MPHIVFVSVYAFDSLQLTSINCEQIWCKVGEVEDTRVGRSRFASAWLCSCLEVQVQRGVNVEENKTGTTAAAHNSMKVREHHHFCLLSPSSPAYLFLSFFSPRALS